MYATKTRYMAPSSSTGVAGVVLLERDGKQVVFSHHGSDPLGDGRPHDAFDVLRILECNGDYKQAFDKARETLGRPPFEPGHHDHEGESLEWDDPQPLPNARPEAPMLPPEMLPTPLRAWLGDAASRACLPLEMFASAALVALSGLIGRTVSIKPLAFSDWEVIPNLWGCVIAPPGSIKSDTTNEAFKPIHKLEQEAREAFEEQSDENEVEKMLLEAQLAEARTKAKKGKTSRDDLLDLTQRLRELKSAARTRFITQDSTVEKLGVILQENPRGLTVLRDELASWLSNLEQDENNTARGFFLTGWAGNSPYSFDTISRGETHISAVCVSVFGNIQPRPLDAIFNRLRSDPTRADGMLQRFQVAVYPQGLPAWQRPTTWTDKQAKENVFVIFQNLRKLELQDDKSILVFFTIEAQAAYNQWHDRLEHRLRDDELGSSPHFHSHISKYRSLAPSLALIFHLVWLASDDFQGWSSIPPVAIDSLHLALDWCEYLETHARKIYSAELNQEAVAAQLLAKRIKDKQVNDGMTVREIGRKGWSGLTGESLDLALLDLEQHNWLKVMTVDPPKQGGRSSEVVRLNPALEGVSL